MDRKIWAFSQKMSWLFWLFWLFLYLSLGKMAFSSWLFWLFAQKARLFWLFAKLGYIVVAFVDVYKLIYHFFHYKVLFTSIFWLFPGFCKKTVCSARLLYLAVRKWQNGNLERKIWAFSQKMRWLFWLFWLFLSITHTTGFFPPKKPGFFGLFWLFRARLGLKWQTCMFTLDSLFVD